MGRGGKTAGPRRRKTSARTRRRRRRPPILLLVALGLLIAGFLVRRALVPRMTHYLAYRPPNHAPSPSGAEAGAPGGSSSNASEHLTPEDRRDLNRVIREKSK